MKKEKQNPLIKEQKKLKNIKVNNSLSDDESVVKKLIIITVIITVLIGIVYIATELVTKEPEVKDQVKAGEVNYDKISVGTILNRPYDEYYVIVYNAEDSNAVLYSTILTKYMQKEKAIKIYFCDLNNKLNNSYYNVDNDNISNNKATKVEDFDFSDLTLMKIKNSKIEKYVEDLETIKDILN